MFYLVHIDRHGGFQGVLEAFSTLKKAKKYLDDRPTEFRRCGNIAVGANHPKGEFTRVIIEIPLVVERGQDGEFDIPEPEEDADEEEWRRYDLWFATIDNTLDILVKHIEFLSDF